MDCGPACLDMVCKYYGLDYKTDYLRQLMHTRANGSTLANLVDAAGQLGFEATPVCVNLNELKTLELPLIIHWNRSHFVVLYKWDGEYAWIADPALGMKKLSLPTFCEWWIQRAEEKGIALVLSYTGTPQQQAEQPANRFNPTRFMYRHVKGQIPAFLLIIFLLLLVSCMQLAFPYLTQLSVDKGIEQKNMSIIWFVLFAQLLLTIGITFSELIRARVANTVSNIIAVTLSSDFMIKVLKLPLTFFTTRSSSDIIQRVEDHSRVQNFISITTISIIFSFTTTIVYAAYLTYYSPKILLVFLVFTIAYYLFTRFFNSFRKKFDTNRFVYVSKAYGKMLELINGIQDIKLFCAEDHKRKEWEAVKVKQHENSIHYAAIDQFQQSGSRLLNDIRNVCTTLIAAKLVLDGSMSMGMMLSVSFIIGQLNGPVMDLLNTTRIFKETEFGLNRIGDVYNQEDEEIIPPEQEELVYDPQQGICFRDLSFAYDQHSPVLNGINLSIPPNKITAIVGSSGSGKTTLLKLLLRFYSPTGGAINVKGNNLSMVPLAAWRKDCGVVLQDGYLFNGTIAENIALGDPAPSEEALHKAAQIANLMEFIDTKPHGFGTEIGNNGVVLSGGQKQRILIARAVYHNPSIILLDEATSNLDAYNERIIMNNICAIKETKTIIIIAHRLSTIRNADNIIVLNKGQIAEQGSHEALLQNESHYSLLVNSQIS